MADLTPETLAQWRKDALNGKQYGWYDSDGANTRILVLLDALDDAERTIAKRNGSLDMAIASAKRRLTRAEQAEAALSRVLDDMEAKARTIISEQPAHRTDVAHGRLEVARDFLDFIEKYRNDNNAH